MTASSPTAGTLHVAAALAFHLPGARLEVSGANGARCSVGPLTDPGCMLHPAEFRDLIVSTGGAVDPLASVSGGSFGPAPRLSLTTAMPGVDHVGSGLYRVAGIQATSYVFATLLPAPSVDAVLSDLQARLPVEYESGQLVPPPTGDEVIAVSLIHDEGLAVTVVVMCSMDTTDAVGEELARTAVSACLVAEMEHAIQSAG